jgi:hypothetical protein
MTPDDEDDPRRRSSRTTPERLQMLEADGQSHARLISEILKASTKFSPEQLEQLRGLFREELADAGLRIDGPEHVDDAREDFRFLRRLRTNWDGAVKKTGNSVLLAIIAIAGTIIGLGFWAWLGSNVNK